jgi:hypothetical protein
MPHSPLEINGRFGGMYRLHILSRRINQAKYQHETGTKMVDFQRTPRRYILEDRILHNDRCENLTSYAAYCYTSIPNHSHDFLLMKEILTAEVM